jgi:hypothetical protein
MQPWIPLALLPYPKARKVLGVMQPTRGKMTAAQYEGLAREKVVKLIKEDPNAPRTIEAQVDLPAHQLNDPESPEAIYQDLKELISEMWRGPEHALIMHLRHKGDLDRVKDALLLDQEEKSSPETFQKELEGLTLVEFLELARPPM